MRNLQFTPMKKTKNLLLVAISSLLSIGFSFAQPTLTGATIGEGTNNQGSIFTYDVTSSLVSEVHAFDGVPTGSQQYGTLLEATDGLLYGSTYSGGTSGAGVLYSMDPTTSIVTKLNDFTGGADGQNCQENLVQVGNEIFGYTVLGGTFNNGTIYKYNIVSSVYTVVHSFNAGTDGRPDWNPLMLGSDGLIYGHTRSGGAAGVGTIWSLDPTTSAFSVEYVFTGGALGGRGTNAFLQHSNGLFYGSTQNGGANGFGVIYSFNPSTSTYTVVYDRQTSAIDGSQNYSHLTEASNGLIYGTTDLNGPNGSGTVFKFDPNTNVYTTTFSFSTSDGLYNYAWLKEASDGFLYASTYIGGANGRGTLYRYDITTDAVTILLDYSAAPGVGLPLFNQFLEVGFLPSACTPTAITPDLTILTDATGQCSVTPTAPTATNDCGDALTGTPDVTLPITTIGTTVVTWTYDDGTNTLTQTQNVVVSGADLQTVSPLTQEICINTSTDIDLLNSEIGFDYYLRDDATNAVVAGPIAGTGGPLVFNTGNLSTNTSYNVLATTTGGPAVGLNFDGVDEEVNCGNGINIVNSSFTLECWAQRNSTGDDHHFFSLGTNVANQGLHIRYNPAGTIRFGFWANDYDAPAGTYSTDGAWHHYAFSYNAASNSRKVYVDGVLIGSDVASSDFVGTGDFLIGDIVSAYGVPLSWDGNIDDVRVWNIERSAGEINADINSCLTGTESNLVALFPLDEGTGTTTSDITGNGNDGILTNMEPVTDWVTGYLNCATSCETQMSPVVDVVIDATAPVAVCQNITVQLDATGNATITAAMIDGGSTDFCPVTLSIPNALGSDQFDCTTLGANTVTLTVTDDNGNTATCNATVTVEDNIAPTVTCNPITVALDGTGNATITTDDIGGLTAADACGIASVTASTTSFTCAEVGDNTVVLTVTDNNGNVTTCNAVVTVEDNELPTAVCQDITAFFAPGASTISIVAGDVDGGSSDNCGIASLAIDNSSFNCSNVGPNTVTLTVTDNNGNVSTCPSIVTVIDTVSPVVICQDITIQLDAAGLASIVAADVNNGSTDNCGIASTTIDVSSFTCANVGANNVTLTVTDVNGNSSTCVAVVTVEDNIAPNAICQDISVDLDATGNASITAAQIDNGSNANCGIASLVLDNTTFTCAEVGANTVTLTVTDNNGNVSTCTSTVTVNDVTPPTAVCQDFAISLDAVGLAVITPAIIDNGSSDACGIASITLDNDTFGCADLGANTVTLTVTDVNGLSSTCTATVTVTDDTNPLVICPGDITLDAVLDNCGRVVNYAVPFIDNCSVSIAQTDGTGYTDGDLFPVGVTPQSYEITDASGNVTLCSFNVTIEDNQTPDITGCPADINVNNDLGTCDAVVSWIQPTASDNCPGVVFTSSHAPGSVFPEGSTTVTYTATDASGNTNTCSFIITVTDNEAPVFVDCPSDIAISTDLGDCFATVASLGSPTVTENCTLVSVTNDAPATFPVGTTVVTWTALDLEGNTSTCIQNVNVTDDENPAAVCANITVQLDASGNYTMTAAEIDGGSTDPCGIASLAASTTTFDCTNIGPNTVTLTVTDNNGNTSTCDATVTVEDNVPPVAICNDITVQLDASGNASIVGADIDGTSTDACGIASVTAAPNTFTCANIGANAVTLTVTDVNGNVSTCNSTVTVEDNVAPTAVCADITVQLDATGNVSIVAADVDGGSTDACGILTTSIDITNFTCANIGANTVTLTVTDLYGNSSTCTSTVTVEDNVAPAALCNDITVQLDASGNVSIAGIDVDGGSTDACGIASYDVVPSAFTCAEVGANTVTLTVTDLYGNTSTCTATVTVEDNVAPTVDCSDITVELDGTGNITIIPDDLFPISTGAYIVDQTGTFAPLPSPIAGTPVSLTDDDVSGALPIGFNFDFYGNTYSNFYISSNGFLTFNAGSPNGCCSGQNLPNATAPNNLIAFAWEDLDPGNGGQPAENLVQYTTIGTAPNRVLVAEYFNVDHWSNGSNMTAQVHLYETSNIIEVHTANMPSDGGLHTQGIENFDGTNAVVVPGRNSNGSWSLTNDYVAFIPTGAFGVQDACGIATTTIDVSTFDCTNVGPNTVVVTATDVNGNSASCTSIVTVVDNVAPTAICQDITVQLDAAGNATIIDTDIDGGSTDACGVASITASQTTFSCSDLGVVPVTLTVIDVNGNSATCVANVTVEDNVAPIITCPADITVNNDAGLCSADVNYLINVTDNCSSALSFTEDFESGPNGWTNGSLGGANNWTIQTTSGTGISFGGNSNMFGVPHSGNGSTENSYLLSPVFSSVGGGDFNFDFFVNNESGGYDLETVQVSYDGGTSWGTVIGNQLPNATSVQNTSFNIAAIDGTVNTQVRFIYNTVDGCCGAQDGFFVDNIDFASSGLTLATTQASGSTFPVGTTPVTATATDASGNSSSCTFNVTVVDNELPVVVCNDITVQLDAAGNATITTTDIDGGLSTDNCGIASQTLDVSSFDCSNVGPNTVTMTVTDVNGNVTNCSSTVTIEDNVAPTAICNDIIVQLDGAGNASIVAADIDGGSSDACGIASVIVSPSTFTCANVGSNTVTLTVTDVNGNVSTCTSTVTVEDNVPPVAICQDITVQLDAAGNATIVGSDIDNGSNAACGIASLVASPNSFDCSNVGPNTVTLTVTDNNGNTATCTSTVTVEDNVAPIAMCQDITVQLDATGNVSITAADLDAGSTDACGIATTTIDISNFDCSNIGANTVTLTVTDVNGNVSTCTSTVTVEDNVDPIITCPADITVSADPGVCDASSVAYGNATATDACGILTIAEDSPAVFPLGNTTITWTATDVNGNTATCTQVVTVIDSENPIITCPADVTVNNNPGDCFATGVVIGTATATDNCSPPLSVTITNDAPSTFPVGITNVTWTATDVEGNTSTCTQIITVIDNEAPVVSCPTALTVNTDISGCFATGVALGTPTVSDNCSGIASVTNDAPLSYPLGTTTVTWTITDNAGNVSTCTQDVTVEDNENPVIVCPADITVSTDLGSCDGTIATLGTELTFDNCTVASVTNDAASLTFPIGTTPVTWTVTDAAGNTATCVQMITVLDTENPMITCPIDVTVSADAASCNATGVALGTPVTTDNCTVASVTNNAPATYPLGNTTVTWTVTDDAGNIATCTQVVTVEDNEAPMITCPTDLTVSTAGGSCDVTGVALGTPVTTDNCSVASVTNDAPVTFALGTTTVTWTVTDGAGNTATCVQLVTVEDNELPTISCPSDVVITADAGQCSSSAVVLGTATGSDNCTVASITSDAPAIFPIGVTTVTWTIVDGAGNTATCEQFVTVTDDELPTIVCPFPITISADAGSCESTNVVLGMPITGDNCLTVNVTNDAPAIFPLGTTTVTWTVEDAAGNIATCTQDVTVTDDELPTIVCPTDVVVSSDPGVCTAVVTLVAPVTNDNCSVASVTNDSPGNFPLGTTTVTWTVTDGSGNVETCTQLVTVEDNEAPVIVCPADLTVDTDPGMCEASAVALGTPFTTDNCSVALVSNNGPAVYPLGSTTVTWTVEDGSGNTTTCTQVVTVVDNEAPTLVCPADITVDNVPGNCGRVVSYAVPTIVDNCNVTALTQTDGSGLTSGSWFPIGSTLQEYTVTDEAGNSFTCSFLITVEDNELPQIVVCPSDMTVYSDANNCATQVFFGTPVASDNCPGVVYSSTNLSGDVYPLGITTVNYDAIDASGNTATCTFFIEVIDTISPVAPTLATIEGGCSVTLDTPTTTDNCGGTITGTTTTVFPVTASGITSVIWSFDDGNGNITNVPQYISIDGVVNATVSVVDDLTLMSNNSVPGVTYQWIDCNTGLPIAGETNQTYMAMINGSYAVEVTEPGCTPETSICYEINAVGIEDITLGDLVVYPNPTSSGVFTVKYEGQINSIELYDMIGRVVQVPTDLSTGVVNGSELANGKYMVRVATDQGMITKEIIVLNK